MQKLIDYIQHLHYLSTQTPFLSSHRHQFYVTIDKIQQIFDNEIEINRKRIDIEKIEADGNCTINAIIQTRQNMLKICLLWLFDFNKEMKVIKEGVIDDDFRNWMDTNFRNWEDGNLLIEVKEGRICCYNADKKVIFIMNGFDFHPFSCKTWKLLFDGKFHFLAFSFSFFR